MTDEKKDAEAIFQLLAESREQKILTLNTLGDPNAVFIFQSTSTLVTAGASAPEDVVEECVRHLRDRFGATVERRTVREEHVSFPLPRELRVLTNSGS